MALIFYKQNLNEGRQFKCKTMILKCFVHILAGESGLKLKMLSDAVLCYEWRRLPKQRRFCHKFSHQGLKALLHCEMFRATCLAMFWRHCSGTNCTKQFHSVTYLATAKIVARQVARKVGLNSTFGNGSCYLSCNDFARC